MDMNRGPIRNIYVTVSKDAIFHTVTLSVLKAISAIGNISEIRDILPRKNQ